MHSRQIRRGKVKSVRTLSAAVVRGQTLWSRQTPSGPPTVHRVSYKEAEALSMLVLGLGMQEKAKKSRANKRCTCATPACARLLLLSS